MTAAATTANATPRVVLIDNYDSFTWNVYQRLYQAGAGSVDVFRNDKITLEQLIALSPSHLVVSPGPGHPLEPNGVSANAIRHFAGKIPVFGVCLGEQFMFTVYGGTVAFAGEIVHGKVATITHDGQGLYRGVGQGMVATRYHSLAGTPDTVPEQLVVTSTTHSGIVMGVRHRTHTVEGVQYHPESVLSEQGMTLFRNFLNLRGGLWADNPGYSILDKIHRQRVIDIRHDEAVPGRSFDDLQTLYSLGLAPPVVDVVERLTRDSATCASHIAVLAEIKRASPSKGDIDIGAVAAQQALAYAHGGASVISVLTEPKWFKGTLDDLREVRAALDRVYAPLWGTERPAVLRKDFIVDRYQILEARLAGADTVLLIVAILTDPELVELIGYTRSLGMEPLVEVNSVAEMERAVRASSRLVGINNRNLNTFHVDMDTTS
ncbi:IGPS-domain-containing protein, partial [Ramicandelaber brevisporus]